LGFNAAAQLQRPKRGKNTAVDSLGPEERPPGDENIHGLRRRECWLADSLQLSTLIRQLDHERDCAARDGEMASHRLKDDEGSGIYEGRRMKYKVGGKFNA